MESAKMQALMHVTPPAGDTVYLKFEYINALENPPGIRSISTVLKGPIADKADRDRLETEIRKQGAAGVWVLEGDGTAWLKPNKK